MKKILLLLFTLCINCLAQNTWVATGMTSGMIRSICVDSTGSIYASRWGIGIYKSTDGGMNWISAGLTGKRVISIASSPSGNIFAIAVSASVIEILRSTTNGNSWVTSHTHNIPDNYASGGGIQFGENGRVFVVNSFTIGPTIGDVAAYMYLSTDSGTTFVNTGIVGQAFNGTRIPTGYVKSIVLGTGNKLFAGTYNEGVLYTTNDGNNWLSAQIPVSLVVYDLEKGPGGKIYAGLSGDDNNLLFTSDNGVSWDFAGLNIPWYERINDMRYSGHNHTLIVATDNFVFRSTDEGNSFDTIITGLPVNASVLTLCNISNGSFLAGTLANGIYLYGVPLGINNSYSNPSGFKLHQNYPNPFNPQTSIRLSIGKESQTKICVFDVSGREVAELLNERKAPGEYEIYWDAKNLPSGVYFYRLSAGEFTDVKKMVLVR